MTRLFTVACVLLNLSPAFSETVSIESLYPSNQHPCIEGCIWKVGSSDIGNALSCGNPYDNSCFCNTASASASAASSWITSCGRAKCSAGDIPADLTSLQSVYASYCMNAGFTQPGATEWYSPSTVGAQPGQTATANSAQTTTQVTVVTQTAASTPSSATTTPSRVTIHTTSTLILDSNGTPLPPVSNSGPNKTILGVGLGLGIPLALGIVGFGLWLCLRRRRRTQPTVPAQVVEPGMEVVGTSAIPRKAVPTHRPSPHIQNTEIMAEGEERTDTFPVPVSPSSPVLVNGEQEVSGEGLVRELPGQSQTPPPDYSQAAVSQPGSTEQAHGQGRRWELG